MLGVCNNNYPKHSDTSALPYCRFSGSRKLKKSLRLTNLLNKINKKLSGLEIHVT